MGVGLQPEGLLPPSEQAPCPEEMHEELPWDRLLSVLLAKEAQHLWSELWSLFSS